ncbi:hypothetical protein STEG23_005793, partial [Scotinomys teguina]
MTHDLGAGPGLQPEELRAGCAGSLGSWILEIGSRLPQLDLYFIFPGICTLCLRKSTAGMQLCATVYHHMPEVKGSGDPSPGIWDDQLPNNFWTAFHRMKRKLAYLLTSTEHFSVLDSGLSSSLQFNTYFQAVAIRTQFPYRSSVGHYLKAVKAMDSCFHCMKVVTQGQYSWDLFSGVSSQVLDRAARHFTDQWLLDCNLEQAFERTLM